MIDWAVGVLRMRTLQCTCILRLRSIRLVPLPRARALFSSLTGMFCFVFFSLFLRPSKHEHGVIAGDWPGSGGENRSGRGRAGWSLQPSTDTVGSRTV